MTISPERPAWVLFDGYCGLCDGLVRSLVARDRRRVLRYGPLQGATAARVRERHPDLPGADETFVLVEAPGTPAERVRTRSDAALAVATALGGAWRLAATARIVPPPLRDAAYRLVARRRHRWWGRLESCRVPTPEESGLFLE